MRWVAGGALAWLAIGLRWPLGVLRRLSAPERLTLFATTVTSLLAIPLLKHQSYGHCPWDLIEFGGTASYLRLFDWPAAGTLRGQCFPAGHVSAATAFFGGWFAFRRRAPRIARAWLAVVMLLAMWTGLAQQARGAHFLSHNLWTAWICYGIALAGAWASARGEAPSVATKAEAAIP
jgi:membrane-associated PAP2 superfamily phosphatase